jgi:predicted permease
MNNFILIFTCLLFGFVLQFFKKLPSNTSKGLNWIVIYICLPALALYYIPQIKWQNQLLYPIGVAWIGFMGSFLLFRFLGQKWGWSKKLTGCLILTAGLGNTSFLGFPIIHALYGEEGLKTAILVDQPGSFVVLSTLGILVATFYSSKGASSVVMIKKILFFPPFVTFAISCLMNFYNLEFQFLFQNLLKTIGSAVTPLALISVGLQLRFEKKSMHWKFLGLGLLYKLFLTPFIIYVVYVFILKQHSLVIQVALMESAMAPMITGCILASSHGLKPHLSSMMIGFGIPLSFISLSFWYFIAHFV